ncbi:MAG: thiamine phosphate synthase [Hyphomicrobiaceae bacterium]
MSAGLYLELEVGAAAAGLLGAALGAARVECVLLRAIAGETIDIEAARQLVDIGQARGAAVLVAGNTRLSRKLNADGIHLDWMANALDEYVIARETLASGSIVGAEAGTSRHDAMSLAEAGADYIGFRPSESRHGEDDSQMRTARLELIRWWAEVTQVPCVAFDIGSPGEAAELVAADVDFVAVTLTAGTSPADAAARVAAIAGIAAGHPRTAAGG